MILNALRSILPLPFKHALRSCQRWMLGQVRYLTQDPLVPSAEQVFVGDGNFVNVGREFMGYFTELGGLKPSHDVLDVGAGQARMALPLINFLSSTSRYVGIEIVHEAVEWCQNAYRKFPNFQFIHADVYNKTYNQQGCNQASTYVFPFQDESFDFVFLTSVFTHMCPEEMRNYLSEISRCLKPGGRCLITFFLLNEESIAGIESGSSTLPFNHGVLEVCRVTQKDNYEAAIAYDEKYVRDAFTANRLSIVGDVHYGNWVKRDNGLSYQDIIIAQKIARR